MTDRDDEQDTDVERGARAGGNADGPSASSAWNDNAMPGGWDPVEGNTGTGEQSGTEGRGGVAAGSAVDTNGDGETDAVVDADGDAWPVSSP